MPDDAAGRALNDGRLNLEQQKKRAKELLRGLLTGEDAAIQRLRSGHPRGTRLKPTEAQLADAQLVLARENGFETWPRLKGHTEALKAARAAAKRPDLAPDTPGTVHVRCGSDLKRALGRAGFVGAFRAFTDPFCQGPVRDLPLSEQIAERAAFVAQAYGLYPDTALERVTADYAGLDELPRFDAVALWFEHDSYDQLILAYLLKRMGDDGWRPAQLICIDRTPGVARFVGLGQLAPEVIRLTWEGRVAVGPEHVALGRRAWAALTSPSPEALFVLAQEGTPAVPPMASALMRHLRELPSTANGLSLTEQMALDVLAEKGPMDARALFAEVGARDPLPTLGDAMFWPILASLAGGARPLLTAPPGDSHHGAWPQRRISLTPDGEAVRRGRRDWLADAAAPRFVGGVEIRPGARAWRWDGARPMLSDGRP